MILYNPDLLNPNSDPEGSERFENVNIVHEKIERCKEEVIWFDDIENTNTFIIQDCSPQYEGYEAHIFKGTVIKERNGEYSWWKNINQGQIST